MKNTTLSDQGFRAGTQECDFGDSYIPKGRVGWRDLSAGCYSFAEAMTLVCEWLVANGKDREALASLRTSGRTVRQYFRDEFGIEAGPREHYTPPRTTPDKADMKWFRFSLDTARWVARRRMMEAKRRAWRMTTPAMVM